jgi:hypothetical protein
LLKSFPRLRPTLNILEIDNFKDVSKHTLLASCMETPSETGTQKPANTCGLLQAGLSGCGQTSGRGALSPKSVLEALNCITNLIPETLLHAAIQVPIPDWSIRRKCRSVTRLQDILPECAYFSRLQCSPKRPDPHAASRNCSRRLQKFFVLVQMLPWRLPLLRKIIEVTGCRLLMS